MVSRANLEKSTDYEGAQFLKDVLSNIFEWQARSMNAVIELSDEIADQAEAIEALIDSTEVIQPELAALISTTIGMGLGLCEILEKNASKFDEVAQKRIAATIIAYRQSSQVTINKIEEITIDPDSSDSESEPEVKTSDLPEESSDVIDQALEDAATTTETQP